MAILTEEQLLLVYGVGHSQEPKELTFCFHWHIIDIWLGEVE